jgi:hypothetical protein
MNSSRNPNQSQSINGPRVREGGDSDAKLVPTQRLPPTQRLSEVRSPRSLTRRYNLMYTRSRVCSIDEGSLWHSEPQAIASHPCIDCNFERCPETDMTRLASNKHGLSLKGSNDAIKATGRT